MYLCSLSYSTYKPEFALGNDLSTRSKQQPLEELDDSLCNMYHGINSQTTSPGKDIYKFSNLLSYKNTVEENIYL